MNCPEQSTDDKEKDAQLKETLTRIKHKFLVLGGKGGVGKTTVAVNLAMGLAMRGYEVGLLDVDIHGPNVAKMLGIEGQPLSQSGGKMLPILAAPHLKVISMAPLLPNPDHPVIWRGPLKMGVIRQFLSDVQWGSLDYLIVDSPPGTGDEPLSVAQLIPEADGAIIVTTPQDVALLDSRKCVNFVRQMNIPVTGIIENMSGFSCPHCGQKVDIFKIGGGEKAAAEMGVLFLGRIPLDPKIVKLGDAGDAFILKEEGTQAARELEEIVERIIETVAARKLAADRNDSADENRSAKKTDQPLDNSQMKKEENMFQRIAIATDDGKVAQHFGRCQKYTLIDVKEGKEIRREMLDCPEHQPGYLPGYLAEEKVTLVIAGGMGPKAQDLFQQQKIGTISGVSGSIDEALQSYLKGTLKGGANLCDSEHHEGECDHHH
ncbi:MAG: iron-sulfur cluster carrier protein MrpORP [bacterium]|nr:iron-sulfur cluster carrier protein MrpORP [bacterium]